MIDQNAAHGLGRGGKEVSAAIELLVPDEAQVRLMDERCRVQAVTGGLRGHARSGERPQLVVDERKQVGSGLTIAFRGSIEETRHVGHWSECTGCRWKVNNENECELSLQSASWPTPRRSLLRTR